jgi:hypothetical protein
MLQDERSRAPFPNPSGFIRPSDLLDFYQKSVPEVEIKIFLWSRPKLMRETDNLTVICEPTV